jgi:hypothetical protein
MSKLKVTFDEEEKKQPIYDNDPTTIHREREKWSQLVQPCQIVDIKNEGDVTLFILSADSLKHRNELEEKIVSQKSLRYSLININHLLPIAHDASKGSWPFNIEQSTLALERRALPIKKYSRKWCIFPLLIIVLYLSYVLQRIL